MNKSDRKAISSCSSSFRCLSPRYCFLCPCCVSEEQSMLTKTQQYMYFISVPENIFPTTVCLAATIYWCLSNKLNYERAQPALRSYFSAAFVPHLVFPILLNHKQFNLRRPRGALPLKGNESTDVASTFSKTLQQNWILAPSASRPSWPWKQIKLFHKKSFSSMECFRMLII